MKKIGLIMATLLFAMISYGQSISNTTGINFTFDVDEDLTYIEYTGSAADTISSTDSTWTYTFAVKNLLDDLKVQGRMVLDMFIVKCPMKIGVKTYKTDEKGVKLRDSKGVYITQDEAVDYSDYVDFLENGDIKVYCSSIQKNGYFRYPVYMTKTKEIIDIRSQMSNLIVQDSQSKMLNRVLGDGAKMVERAMSHNPHVKYNQMSPEKTQAEKHEDSNL